MPTNREIELDRARRLELIEKALIVLAEEIADLKGIINGKESKTKKVKKNVAGTDK